MSKNDKVIRSIKVKTEQRNKGPNNDYVSKDNVEDISKNINEVDLAQKSLSSLDEIFSKASSKESKSFEGVSSGINKAVYDTKESIDTQTDIIKSGNKQTELMSGALADFNKSLKAKIGFEMDSAKPEVKSALTTIDDSTLGAISKSVSNIEKRNSEQIESNIRLNDTIQELLDENGNSTSAQIMGEEIHQELEEQGDHFEQQAYEDNEEKNEEQRKEDIKVRNRRLVIRTLGFIGSIISKIAKTLFRFSVGAIAAAAKWGAILFAIVFGFDVLNKHLSHWFGVFNTSLESLDTNTGLMAPWLESLFRAFTTVKDYLVDGEFWLALKAVFVGAFDIVVNSFSLIGVSISKMVAGLLRFFGAKETGDKMEASAIKGYSMFTNYRLSDEDIDLISKVESRDQRDLIDTANKRKWSDEDMAIAFQNKYGMQTKSADPEILARLSELREIYKSGGMEGLEEANKDIVSTKNKVDLISKRSDQYSSNETRLNEFISETQRLRDHITSTDGYGGSERSRDADLKQIQRLEDEINRKLDELKERRKPKQDVKDSRPTENIELISESMASGKGSNITNLDNKIQNNRNTINNNSILNVPVQTSRDVPGMYRSTEINA